MASRKTPLLILPRTIKYSSILPQTGRMRGGGHAIRSAYNIELSARSGVETTDFLGCIVYRPIYMASRKTPLLILPRTIKYSSILPQTVESRGGGHAIRSAYNIELFGKKRGRKRLILGCIVYRPIYGLQKDSLYLYCHELSNILRYCHKTGRIAVAAATQYAQHIIQNFRQEAGSKLTDFGCIVYRPIYMASRKTPSTYIATNYQIFFDIATNWQNRVAAATQYAQHIIQNFRQEAGRND